MIIEREITVRLTPREDGGLRVSSDELPGLILSGSDEIIVLRALGDAIVQLLRRQQRKET
jgi:hypothetical protein